MKRYLYFMISLCLAFAGCSNFIGTVEDSRKSISSDTSRKKNAVSVVNWNVQTFFDSETEGTEYEEFKSNARWSKDKYLVRLHRLCEVITGLNADIYVFEEIENVNIFYDIANQLAGNSWNSSKNWNYACFSKKPDSGIGCGILSKFSLEEMKLHGMDIRTQKEVQPMVRDVLEVTVNVNGEKLVLLGCHWKSKNGGSEETELWRDWQEYVLSNCISEMDGVGKNYVLVAGDFNRSAEDFVTTFGSESKVNTVLRGKEKKLVFNPWFYGEGSFICETGSYFYDNHWERIDNFFASEDLELMVFGPKTNGNWTKANGLPFGYKIYNGEGYSDHLPIMCTVVF